MHIRNGLPQKQHMIGLEWLVQKRHARLFGCAVSFLMIATMAGRHQIFPGIGPAMRSRNHMIHRQIPARAVTILATVIIPPEHIFPAQHN